MKVKGIIVLSVLVTVAITYSLSRLRLCSSSVSSDDIAYAFFVAGHAYGNPAQPADGLYEPLMDYLPELNRNPKLRFGVFLGDALYGLSPERIESFKRDVRELKVPVYLAVGNHEVANDVHRAAFEKAFNKTMLRFGEDGDLHILLDTCRDNWNIVGDQLDFLTSTLRDKGAGANRIFIYQHNIIWYAQDLHYRKLFPNSFWGWEQGKLMTNFWPTVVPLLLKVDKPVFVFAGDVNAYPDLTTAYYERIGKLHLIATGMGNGKTDNIVVVSIPKNTDEEPITEMVSLDSSDPRSLGKLESFGLSGAKL